ncbi:MAG: hypothetical protein RR630_07090 [Coprobacillus sp.]
MKKIINIVIMILCIIQLSSHCYAKESIDGPTDVMIPNAGESVANYTLGKGYSFSPINQTGISLNKDGVLTLTKNVKPQELIIVAKKENRVIRKKVSLYYSWSRDNEKYQIKESINPIPTFKVLTNTGLQKGILYAGLSLISCVFIGYILKRKGIL